MHSMGLTLIVFLFFFLFFFFFSHVVGGKLVPVGGKLVPCVIYIYIVGGGGIGPSFFIVLMRRRLSLLSDHPKLRWFFTAFRTARWANFCGLVDPLSGKKLCVASRRPPSN